jgi:hypothetical protein
MKCLVQYAAVQNFSGGHIPKVRDSLLVILVVGA